MPRPEVADDSEGKKKNGGGNRSQSDQSNVDDAVDLLARTAAVAGGEVAFVVFAHLRRQAGDVVTPARQNLPYNGINTLLTHTY